MKKPTTVEAQIRSRARNLPIYKCYVNEDWEESKLAIVTITRKHTNGNITVAVFEVDLKLRGITDCIYKFNETQRSLDEIVSENPELHEECGYELAHNIIHAALEFAEENGFKPHRNFKTAQYILEEDTDDIPIIEIPLGDDDDERPYAEVVQDILDMGPEKYIEKYGIETNSEIQALTDMVYIAKVYTEEEREKIDNEVDLIIKDPRLLMTRQKLNVDEKELEKARKYFYDEEYDKGHIKFRKIIEEYPNEPLIWSIYLECIAMESERIDEDVVNEAYSLFPEHPTIKAWYAEWLAQEYCGDKVIELFDNKPGLDALTTDKNQNIDANAFFSFCNAYAMAWLEKENILQAETYYQLIVRMQLYYRFSEDIRNVMNILKKSKLEEMES